MVMVVQACALQLVNQHAAPHLHPHRHHLAPSQYRYLAHSRGPPDNPDAWDHPGSPDVVDSPAHQDVWDLWDRWDLLEHRDAPVFQLLLLLPVRRSVFNTVLGSVLSLAALHHLPLCVALPRHLPCQLPCLCVLPHAHQLVVNQK